MRITRAFLILIICMGTSIFPATSSVALAQDEGESEATTAMNVTSEQLEDFIWRLSAASEDMDPDVWQALVKQQRAKAWKGLVNSWGFLVIFILFYLLILRRWDLHQSIKKWTKVFSVDDVGMVYFLAARVAPIVIGLLIIFECIESTASAVELFSNPELHAIEELIRIATGGSDG